MKSKAEKVDIFWQVFLSLFPVRFCFCGPELHVSLPVSSESYSYVVSGWMPVSSSLSVIHFFFINKLVYKYELLASIKMWNKTINEVAEYIVTVHSQEKLQHLSHWYELWGFTLTKKNQMDLYFKNIIIKDRLVSVEEQLIWLSMSGPEVTYKGSSCTVLTLEQELPKVLFWKAPWWYKFLSKSIWFIKKKKETIRFSKQHSK